MKLNSLKSITTSAPLVRDSEPDTTSAYSFEGLDSLLHQEPLDLSVPEDEWNSEQVNTPTCHRSFPVFQPEKCA